MTGTSQAKTDLQHVTITFSLKRSLVKRLGKKARETGFDSIVSRSRLVEQLLEGALR